MHVRSLVTIEQNRRELVAFCQQYWQFKNFRHNKGEIGILPLMVRLLIDTYLTEDTSRQRATMNGTVSQLHKSGGTNKTSDQRPVVLLNSVYQLLNYAMNERLKKTIEPANILELGQGGGMQGRCVGINMQKVHFIQQEVRRRDKRVYWVDIDLKTPSTPSVKQRSGW